MRSVKPYDHYYLEGDVIDPAEAERAIRGFIRRVEQESQIQPELLKFIAKGLKKQYESGDIHSWAGRKSGRPSSPPCNYLDMLAWHRFHLDPKFNTIPKTTETGRHFAVAESFKKENVTADADVILAERLSYSYEGSEKLDSESSIKRAIKRVQSIDFLDYRNISSITLLEIFCLQVLKVQPKLVEKKMEEIRECWKKNCKVQK